MHTARSIKHIIDPKDKDLGGFSVRRCLPSVQQKMVGPWIFFDHMGPAKFPAGEGINVRPHPHINLATVTYLFDGEILHRDSLGSVQAIKPGDINLMVAGCGITHSERERSDIRDTAHTLDGLQLWHALPEEHEETDPAFYHYKKNEIPSSVVNGVDVRVLMGQAYGVSSPVKTFADTLYVEARLNVNDALTTPKAEQLAVYVISGRISLEGNEVQARQMVILEDNGTVTVNAERDSVISIIGGEKLTHRYIDWNFVSSRKERIQQAKDDWRTGRFPTVPGDDKEFIPLP